MAEPTKKQLKEWERKWKKFLGSCSDELFFPSGPPEDEACSGVTLYRDTSVPYALYTDDPHRSRRKRKS